jgi:hypothetical protein
MRMEGALSILVVILVGDALLWLLIAAGYKAESDLLVAIQKIAAFVVFTPFLKAYFIDYIWREMLHSKSKL